MLNVEKIKLMTNLSIYEGKEAKKNMVVNRFFKQDYISYHMIKAFVNVTISYLIIAIMYFIYKAEDLIAEIQNVDFISLGIMLVVIYLVSLTIYLTIAYLTYDKNYDTAKKNLKSYQSGLKRLNRTYELSARAGDTKKED